MFELEFTVNVESYLEWVSEMRTAINTMVITLENVAEYIRIHTIPFVPLDTSALEQSFEYMAGGYSPLFALVVGFDAVDEDSGFHYAEYQHDNILHHPKRGTEEYLIKGMIYSKDGWMELIETDYLSLFMGGRVMSSGVGRNTGSTNINYMNKLWMR